MGQFQSVFCRREIKYLLDERQYLALCQVLARYTEPDAFPTSAISNLYYDTPDYLLIRRSLEKPKYKEKLRLRCYNVPQAGSEAFVEIKKKVDSVVYKRRESLPYGRALEYLARRDKGGDSQIFRELDWLLAFYGDLAPAMFLSYDRVSLKGTEQPGLRVTFDRNILYRTDHLDLSEGVWGTPLLRPGQYLMELKVPGAMPLWMSDALSDLRVYPTSFSKYGAAYQAVLASRAVGSKTTHLYEEVRKYA